MRDMIDLQNFWRGHQGRELGLCTLIAKTGSAYRLPGARKIVARDPALGACGLLSGGCLEPDIENAVREDWDKLPFIRHFSTMSPEDKLLGYQTGCAGVIEVLCERLPADIAQMDMYLPFGDMPPGDGVLISLHSETLGQRRIASSAEAQMPDSFFDRWRQPVHLIVVGCGIDAAPFMPFAAMLGWRLSFLDYRDSLRGNLPPEADVRIMPLAAIASAIPEGGRVAVMLMTHNYQADLAVLSGLVGREFGYIGCLGPRGRYEQLRAELPAPLPLQWERIIHAPAGINIKSHTPVAIALSVVTQIQALLGAA